MKHLLSIKDLSKKEILDFIKLGIKIKKNPKKYHNSLYEKVLLTFFQMPSLRTELSFDAAMFTMGGEVIDYHSETSPWAKGKESIEDVAKVMSRYCDAVMIRMHDHNEFLKFAKNSSIPVINGLTSFEHPVQILGDLMTILEKKKKLKGLKIAYLGDSNNNVTHSLMFACQKLGIKMSVACPNKKEFYPDKGVVKYCKSVKITSNVEEAVKDSDVVYTDSWMSYKIPKSQHNRRAKTLRNFQVNSKVMKLAKKAIFMHCLPALRGEEVTKDVIDGKQSVVFDQAENRKWIEMAVLLRLIKR
ncbi:MAG: ornithine carbamoyltransferase [Candidatus Woesearchaeota archaeon]|nr:MAG: ornithine carbamoyltransferase [Candidatus Woesearchaeota archaeon]